ncbi:MAG: PD-(D/E)XK nuclease domain-containing protein, partial [Desulfovibrionaceae bacterium]|nr:PD-(D/E)XK nuclease domain-containing protein [Desulfovibrionaceae bacterium]
FDILSYKNREIYKTIDELSNRYEITNIPIEILLFQAGYFTIRKGTNDKAHLVFPNTEVEDSLLSLYLTANNIKISTEVDAKIGDIVPNIDQKNLPAIVDTFNATLNDCVSSLSQIFQDERSVRDILYAHLPQNLELQKIKERETVKGRSDLELLTRHTYMVIEFKRTKENRDAKASLKEAIEQIKCRNYGKSAFQTKILYRVAMVISTEEKKILLDYCKEVD